MEPEALSKEIADGRVVAILKDGESWLSPGEVTRLGEKSKTEPLPSEESTPEPPPQAAPAPAAPDNSARLTELEQRCQLLSNRNGELESINKRLKTGLQETEASLRRIRNAKGNLENDIISFQEQIKKLETRSSALEREVQHLTHEMERAEEQHSLEIRRFRSMDRNPDRNSESGTENSRDDELAALLLQMQEKDRIIAQEYQERAVLRAQVEDRSQKYYELKARYEKEKAEWSAIHAQGLQAHGQLKSQLEEMQPKTQKGWNPFRRDK